MKHFYFATIFMLFLAVQLSAQTSDSSKNSSGINFRQLSFSEALKAAKEENKLLFMDCYTTWCGPCKMLSNVVFKDSAFAAYFNSRFVNLKMDMEKGEGIDLKKRYEVRAFPTLLFINAEGQVVHRLVGASDAKSLLKNVQLLMDSGGLSSFDKKYESGQRDSTFLRQYIDILESSNNDAKAQQVAVELLTSAQEKILQSDYYLSLFLRYVKDVKSPVFEFVVQNKEQLCQQYPKQQFQLENKIFFDWVNSANQYLQRNNDGCKVDEAGLAEYVKYMTKHGVKEAQLIAEKVQIQKDVLTNDWKSFSRRGKKLFAKQNKVGDNRTLLYMAGVVNKSCSDSKVRQLTASWCERARKDLLDAEEVAKKNLTKGAVLAVSMVDYKGKLQEVADHLRKPML